MLDLPNEAEHGMTDIMIIMDIVVWKTLLMHPVSSFDGHELLFSAQHVFLCVI